MSRAAASLFIVALVGAPSLAAPPASAPAAGDVFVRTIHPLLIARCGSCHGEDRQRGELALHTVEAIARGGESGPLYVGGKPEASELVRRLRLPLDDLDHMPPEGKPQLTPEEISQIEAWIASGAPFAGSPQPPVASAPAGDQPITASPATAPARVTVRTASAALDEPPAPDAASIAELRARLVHVEPIARGSNRLLVDFAAVASAVREADVSRLLKPLLPQLDTLSLARCAIGDETVSLLAGAPRLRRLDLRATRVTDASAGGLAQLVSLRELVLAQTDVTDAAVEHLRALPALERLYVWKTAISAPALARLRSGAPHLRIDAGSTASAPAQETESEVKFTSDAPPPGTQPAATRPATAAAPAPTAAAATAAPLNTKCPVSGNAADPRFTIVHNGRTIAFCCPNCPAQFWADPAKFETKVSAAGQ